MTSKVDFLVIVGATGFVGRHLMQAAPDWAADVVVVTRGGIADPSDARVVRGDVADPTTLQGRLPVGSTVVNLAYDHSATVDANLAIADGLAAMCSAIDAKRLVHVSTATVIGASDDLWITEDTPCRPLTPYQQSKLAVERRLRDRCCVPLVVLRPTAVFGSAGQNLRKLVHDLQSRPAIENYARACLFGRRAMNLVPVETVLAAIAFAATSERAIIEQMYLVAADEDPANNFADVESLLRTGLGLPPRTVPPLRLPTGVLAAVLKLTGRFALNPNARFSSDRLRRAGNLPGVPFVEAVTRYAVDSRSSRPGRTA
jgi:nucleoside-diphosphate-sugar epimerase